MNFLDLFTTETPNTVKSAPAPSKADRRVVSAIGSQPTPQTIAMPSAILPTTDNDETYQKLAAATSFETSEVGAKIQKYLTPLTGYRRSCRGYL